jgi:hypothetical protein
VLFEIRIREIRGVKAPLTPRLSYDSLKSLARRHLGADFGTQPLYSPE